MHGHSSSNAIKPRTITDQTTNSMSVNGHTHEIQKASEERAGIVKVINNLDSKDKASALSAAQGKVLADMIKQVSDGSSESELNKRLEVALSYLSTRYTASYATLDNANKNIKRHPENALIFIVNDPDLGNTGLWVIQGGVLVKAPYDVLASAYTSDSLRAFAGIMTAVPYTEIEYLGQKFLSASTFKAAVDKFELDGSNLLRATEEAAAEQSRQIAEAIDQVFSTYTGRVDEALNVLQQQLSTEIIKHEAAIQSFKANSADAILNHNVQSARALEELRNAVQTIAIDDGVPAQAVVVGDSTLDVFANNTARYTALPYKAGKEYAVGERVTLVTGNIVQNIAEGNTVDPNVDMMNWVKVNAASQIFDESGKNQQEINNAINFKNALIVTIEQLGGVSYFDDPTFDNSDVIDRLFKENYSIYDKAVSLTSTEIRSAINSAKPVVLKLNSLYRITKPFHIPPNVTIEQPFEGYFTQNAKVGLFYDPVDLNTYAVAPFLYRRNINGTYDLDTDVMSMPTGFDFDDGTCIMCGVRQQLKNLFVITKRGVTLAYRLVGWAGCYAENIGCGENQSTWARNPKVACLVASAWGARINGINTLSTHQGFVSYNANGGLVVDGMYTNQSTNTDYAPTNDLIEPIYKPTSYTSLGSTGVMQIGEGKFNSPICEGWYNAHVSSNRVSIDEPHYERISGYNFYLINCEADINLKGAVGIEALSIFYLKDYRDFSREVRVRGLYSMGGNLVTGENSDPSLVLDVLRPHTFIQFYKWGNLNLIKSIENKWGVTQVYVNPTTGDDSYVGLRDIRPIKTLNNAKTLCRLFNITDINILSEITVSSTTYIPKKVRFLGSKIVLNTPLRITEVGDTSVEFLNSEVSGATTSVLLFNGQYNHGYINVTASINCPSAVFIQATGSSDIDVNIKNTTTNLASINYCPTTQQNAIGWNVLTTNYSVPYNFGGGGGFFKSLCSALSVGSLSVASELLSSNTTKKYDISVKLARSGMLALATHFIYKNGLTYTAIVKSSGTVEVSVYNSTTEEISIPAGNIIARVF